MKYKAFQIQDKNGKSIGKQEYYTTLGKAKCGARHIWSSMLKPGCKIVELEVSEKPLSIVEILVKTTQEKNYRNQVYERVRIEGFSDQANTLQKEEIPQLELIKFN